MTVFLPVKPTAPGSAKWGCDGSITRQTVGDQTRAVHWPAISASVIMCVVRLAEVKHGLFDTAKQTLGQRHVAGHVGTTRRAGSSYQVSVRAPGLSSTVAPSRHSSTSPQPRDHGRHGVSIRPATSSTRPDRRSSTARRDRRGSTGAPSHSSAAHQPVGQS